MVLGAPSKYAWVESKSQKKEWNVCMLSAPRCAFGCNVGHRRENRLARRGIAHGARCREGRPPHDGIFVFEKPADDPEQPGNSGAR